MNQLLNVSASMRFKKIKIISLNETAARFMTSGSLNIWGRMRAFPADLRRTNGRLKLQERILGKATIVFIRKPCIPSKRELGRGCTGFYLYTNTVFFSLRSHSSAEDDSVFSSRFVKPNKTKLHVGNTLSWCPTNPRKYPGNEEQRRHANLGSREVHIGGMIFYGLTRARSCWWIKE